MKLSAKLLGVTWGVVGLVIVVAGGLVYRYTESALETSIGENRLGIARQTMERIDGLLYERLNDIQAIAGENFFLDELNGREGERERNLKRLHELSAVTGPWHKLFAVDARGEIVLATDAAFLGKSIALEPNRDAAFRAAMAGRIHHSDLILLADIKKHAVMFSAPVRDRGRPDQPVVGAVLGGFAKQALVEVLENVSGRAALVNRNGEIIAHNFGKDENFDAEKIKRSPYFKDVLAARANSFVVPASGSLSGSAALVSYIPQQGRLSYRPDGWGLILEIPAAAAFAPAARTARDLVLLLLPVFIVAAAIFIAIVSKIVLKPVAQLTQTARAIGRGDHSRKVPVVSQDELGELAASFNRMLEHLNATTVSRDWFEVMVSSIGDAVISTDTDSVVTFMNAEAERLTGWSAAETVGKKSIHEVFRIINVFTRKTVANPVERVIREGVTLGLANHTLLIRKDGAEFPIDDSGAPIRDEKGEILGAVLVFRNVSEKYRQERLLMESEARYRSVTDSTTDAIVSIDGQGCVIFWNRAAARIFGYEKDEIMGREMSILMPESFRVAHRNGLKRFLATREPKVIGKTLELMGLKKSGEEFPIELTLSLAKESEETLFTGLIRDISQRRAIEEQNRQLELRLQQARKLEAVGQLAAGVAHEINTPIQFIGDNVRFLQEAMRSVMTLCKKTFTTLMGRLPESERLGLDRAYREADVDYLCDEIPKAMQQSLEGVARVAGIVSAMKEFSHPGLKNKTFANLNQGIESTVLVSRNEWKYVAEVKTELAPDLPLVSCFPNEMNQVFLNLIVNAAHAVADRNKGDPDAKGCIVIRTRRAGDDVEIEIEDDGIGIPEDIRDRVFDPFFTTKDIGKGTGQGLSIAYAVVNNMHKGRLSFRTETGRGTVFSIALPINGAV